MDDLQRRRWDAARRNLRLPILLVVTVAVLSAGVSLLMPRWYRARTVLLPPQEGSTPYGELASLIESSALSKVGLVATSSPSDLFVEILKSRTVREAVIHRFDLQHRFHEPNLDLCLKHLNDRVKVGVLQSRAIELTVDDKDPAFASDMANELIAQLDSVNIRLQQDKGVRTGEFLVNQLADVADRMHAAEARLTTYEKAHGVFASEEAGVTGVADLMASKLSLQVRRTWLASYSNEDSPALKAIDSELSAIDENMARLPGIKQEGGRIALDVEVQRRVYTLLLAQVEEARLRSRGRLSTVTVLDPSRPPTYYARPHRSIIVLVATAVAALLAGAWLAWRVQQEVPPVEVRER